MNSSKHAGRSKTWPWELPEALKKLLLQHLLAPFWITSTDTITTTAHLHSVSLLFFLQLKKIGFEATSFFGSFVVPFYINFAPGGDPGDALRSHLLTLFWNHFFVLPVPFLVVSALRSHCSRCCCCCCCRCGCSPTCSCSSMKMSPDGGICKSYSLCICMGAPFDIKRLS